MMDIQCNEVDIKIFTGELEKCEAIPLVNSCEPTKIICGIKSQSTECIEVATIHSIYSSLKHPRRGG